MQFLENIKRTFQQGGALIKLIYINVAVFLVIKLVEIALLLFNVPSGFILTYLAVPADLELLLHHFWTPVTYMFLHERILHILFNMLCLFWFGKIFLSLFSEKQLVSLYVFGGLVAAAFYIAAFNIFPYYRTFLPLSILLGASGSIMAIIVATAVKSPNSEVQLFLIGGVKLKYIAIVSVLISIFGLTSDNGGGQMAHLGGAFGGWLFVYMWNKIHIDITRWITIILDAIVTLFRPGKRKLKKSKSSNNYRRMSDGEFNINKAQNMAEIDRILDKIKSSGYESLTADEKKRLFDQGRK